MKDRSTLLTRIYRLKLLFVGALLVILGLLTSTLAEWLKIEEAPQLLTAVVDGLSSVFLVTGAIGIAVDFFTGRDKEAADVERNRQVQKELIPDYVDAVIDAFAFKRDDVARVATPELLDDLATNALALRLGDEQFAREIYEEVRDQAIRAPERWRDVEVDLRFSAIAESRTPGPALFDLTVQWEYTSVPSQAARRFVCLSDRDELNELLAESPATVPWFMTPRDGMDATKQECFELLAFTVDGKPQPIRRSVRKTGQTYTATIDDEFMQPGKAVRMKHIYRVVTPQWGHRLFVQLPYPTRGFSLAVDYTDAPVASMSVTDTVATVNPAQISRWPERASGKVLSVEVPGWLMPKTGFTLTWVLNTELPREQRSQGSQDRLAS